uniref:Uncharacterized protein n=1 Tax=viral metagenome TaxID=1070528 RepID=A0A6M3K2E9_9ZZZZ
MEEMVIWFAKGMTSDARGVGSWMMMLVFLFVAVRNGWIKTPGILGKPLFEKYFAANGSPRYKLIMPNGMPFRCPDNQYAGTCKPRFDQLENVMQAVKSVSDPEWFNRIEKIANQNKQYNITAASNWAALMTGLGVIVQDILKKNPDLYFPRKSKDVLGLD